MRHEALEYLINICGGLDKIINNEALSTNEYWGLISVKNMMTQMVDECMMNDSIVTESRINKGYSREAFTSKVWVDERYPFPENVWRAMFYIGDTKEGKPLTWIDLELFNYIAGKYPVVSNSVYNASHDAVELWRDTLLKLHTVDDNINPDRDLKILLGRFYLRKTIADIAHVLRIPTSRVNSIINNTLTKLHRFYEGDYVSQGG